jgi:hypothetical protein
MAMARRVSLFEREVRVGLSSAAVSVLLDRASVLSEGQITGDQYQGSTMITIDLTRVSDKVSDPCDISTARSLGDLLTTDDRARRRAVEIAVKEAERLAHRTLTDVQVDLSVRRTGRHLHLDLDVEATTEG